MRYETVDVLCCPNCKNSLEINIEEKKENEVSKGKLFCKECNIQFKISDGIPNLFLESVKTKNKHDEYIISLENIQKWLDNNRLKGIDPTKLIDPGRYFNSSIQICLILARIIILFSVLASLLKIFSYTTSVKIITIALFLWLLDFVFYRKRLRRKYFHELMVLEHLLKSKMLHEKDIKEKIEVLEEDKDTFAKDRDNEIEKFLDKYKVTKKLVIHIGCGGKDGEEVSRPYFERDCEIIGVDIDQTPLKEFKKHFNSEAVFANGTNLPFKNDYFDIVNYTDILEHLHDPKEGLKEAMRILKPGGNILIVTPNRTRIKFNLNILNPIVLLEHIIGNFCHKILPPREMLKIFINFNYFHTSFAKTELLNILKNVGIEVLSTKIKSYRGFYKKTRAIIGYIPILNYFNDSIFVMGRKPAKNG